MFACSKVHRANIDFFVHIPGRVNLFESNRIAVSVNRKKEINYQHSNYEIEQLFGEHIVEHDSYPEAFRAAMGDEYYFAVFTSDKDVKAFEKFVHDRK
jgi:hypothetical protein